MERRDEGRAQRVVGVGELTHQTRARLAPVEVRIDSPPVACRQPVADVGTEVGRAVAALCGVLIAKVRLQVGLAQPLTSAIRQRGHRVGRETQQRRHFGNAAPLHLGVPQHQLPPLGKGGERSGSKRTVLLAPRRIEQGDVHFIAEVVGGLLAVATNPVVEHVAHGSDQVGPKRHIGPAPRLQRAQHPRERLGRDVVGVGTRPGERPRRRPRRVDVATIELAIRVAVTLARATDQLGITELSHRHGDGHWDFTSFDASTHRSVEPSEHIRYGSDVMTGHL